MNNNPSVQVMKIIWGALLVALLVYVGISFTMLSGGQPPNWAGLADFSDPLRIPLITTGFISLAMSATLPKIMLVAQKRKRKSAQPMEMREMANLFFVPLIIRLALLESVTLYGFVLVQMKKDPAQIVPFAAVSIVGFLLAFPSEEKIRTTLLELP
jgi:cytochrome bd-type quinol oxidase subunit 2